MKKIILIIGIVFFCAESVKAQNITDALRYGSDRLDGTARFMSMGGAFGALGGDMSALKVNPAGSAVFMANQAAFTFDVSAYKNKVSYMEESLDYKNNDVDLNQAGAIFVFNNANEADAISRLSFGVTYDRTNSFDNRFRAQGISNESVSDMFMDFAQGVPLDLLTPMSGESLDDLYGYLGSGNEGFNNNRLQTAYLGYEGFLFDAVDPDDMQNTDYVSNVTGNSFDQVYEQYERGTNAKLGFNGGIAIKDQFYFGLNLNSHIIDFKQTLFINEMVSGNSPIQEINYGNYLDTRGSGFSFDIGGIARVGDMFRVGASYSSPTWYSIREETSQILRTYHRDQGEVIVNPYVVNVYPRYSLRTPGKATGSIAAVFGGSGLISFDYSYQDFSNTKYSSNGFKEVNASMADNLQAVSTYRIGGEYRIKSLSLRGGFRYEDSPYKDDTMGDLTGYSAGLGYDFGGIKIDFAYDLAKRDYNAELLQTGYTNQASIKNSLSSYVLSLVFPL